MNFREFLNEKSYRLSRDTSTPIGGAVAQLIKKYTEKTQLSSIDERKLANIWQSQHAAVSKLVVSKIDKVVGLSNVIGITISSYKKPWIKSHEDSSRGIAVFNMKNDFVVNVLFADDANAAKYKRRLKGTVQTGYASGDLVYGELDDNVQYIEIRDTLQLMFDDK